MRSSVLAALALPATLLTGCAWGAQDCTAIGSMDGVMVELAPELWLVSGSADITVCDDGCASFENDWARRPKIGGLPGLTATFDDLGRSFEPGTVQVSVELRDEAGELVAQRDQEVELSRVHPNGEDCDGDGWVNGSMTLTLEDAVVAPA